ncbi:hypothetical protein [Methylobacterium crusticola]|nr:hypothetical protein [Methylobacterium crusticola]
MNTLQERVSYLLDLRDISQAEAARRGGFKNTAFINDLVRGHKISVRGESITNLARALATSEDFLLGKISDPDKGVVAGDFAGSEGTRTAPTHVKSRRTSQTIAGDMSKAAHESPGATGTEHPILIRLQQRIAHVGLSEAGLAEQAKQPDAVSRLRRSLVTDGDRPHLDIALLNALAKPLATTATWLITGIGANRPGIAAAVLPTAPAEAPEDEVVLSASRVVEAMYGGVVEAGTFREVDEFSDVAPPRVSALADEEYPYARMLVFDVRGDSMDALKPQPIIGGSRLSGLDFESLRGRAALYTGMVVVIERMRDGGHLRELSVKQLELYQDRYEFHPRSSNTKHKPIIVPHDRDPDDGQEVRLLAWVREIRHRI